MINKKNIKVELGNYFPFLADLLLNLRFLLKHDKSQFGESKLLSRLVLFGNNETFYYLELGSGHPITYSNSWKLPRNWIGIHVDPNKSLSRLWKVFRPKDLFLPYAITSDSSISEVEYFKFPRRHSVLNSVVPEFLENWKTLGFNPKQVRVKAITVTNCLKSRGIHPDSLTLLMCDIEGYDKHIIAHLLDVDHVHPQWILVEDFNSEIETFLTTRSYRKLGTAGPTKLFEKII